MSSIIKVLIVDDSAFMIKTIKQMLATSSRIQVVGVATNGKEAVELTHSLKPDIITMDIEMPVMNGIDATIEIMRTNPTPILVFSSHSSEGAQVTLDVLNAGAVDFVLKTSTFNSAKLNESRDELVSRIIAIAQSTSLRNGLQRKMILNSQVQASKQSLSEQVHDDIHQVSQHTPQRLIERLTVRSDMPNSSVNATGALIANSDNIKKRPDFSHFKALVIGISTGGPISLQTLLPELPANLPVPVFVIQHMPAKFTQSLAERLDSLCKLNVKEAEHGDIPLAGNIYIAPGGMQMTITKYGSLAIGIEPVATLYKPSVEVFGESLFNLYGGKILAVMMTGMGHDGSNVYTKIHKAGGYVLAQDEKSCVVYGMPKAVVESGSANEVHPLSSLGQAINECLLPRITNHAVVGAGTSRSLAR
jgi:two-component system, chemotaxis family, protein-glutamate methylesterase/glutaminase